MARIIVIVILVMVRAKVTVVVVKTNLNAGFHVIATTTDEELRSSEDTTSGLGLRVMDTWSLLLDFGWFPAEAQENPSESLLPLMLAKRSRKHALGRFAAVL